MKRNVQFVRRIGLTLSLVALLTSTVLVSGGCAKPSPNLNPQATAAFHQMQVIRYLDMARDAANSAHHTVPPLLDAAWTLKVVNWHSSAVLVTKAAANGWRDTLYAGMTELLKSAPPNVQNLLAPYLAAAKSVIQQVLP